MTAPEDDKPGLRQKLHWATADRDAEAAALADRAGEDVDEDDAAVAVSRAHGERRDVEPAHDDDLATVDEAKQAADEDQAGADEAGAG
jgi:hypothetical protein